MLINFNSKYHLLANKTKSWISSDSLVNFTSNFIHNKDKLIENKLINPFKKIVYKFNNYGFRNNDFEFKDSVMFLGCSYTFGLGINEDESFSYIVSKKLNLQKINISIPGSSCDTAFRLGYYWIPKLMPKIVIHITTHRERLEIVEKNKFIDLSPSNLAIVNDKELIKFYEQHWLLEDSNVNLNFLKNDLALENICLKNKIKYVSIEYCNLPSWVDLGRDLAHSGPITNQLHAEYVISKI